LVLRPGGDYDEITCLDVLIYAVDRGFALAGGEGQDLVDCVFL